MFFQNLVSFFIDPVLRAPTIGCMLMSVAAAMVGVIVFLRKQSLVGEALSHASYPGVMIGVLIAGIFGLRESDDLLLSLLILIGAFFTALMGLYVIHFLERKIKVPSDAALCFVLSAFFGLGLTLASQIQFIHTNLYKQALTYLFGQVATMTDWHIFIYGFLALIVVLMVFAFYKELQVITFDRQYAKSLGIRVRYIDTFLFIIIVLAVVIGIRSVGVVLMSAMLIAPAAAARQFTNHLLVLFLIAAGVGLISGFLGNYLSVEISLSLLERYPSSRLTLPTGPVIVLVATSICLLSLLFAPKRGLFLRLFRVARFRYRCLIENLLKAIWRHSPAGPLSLKEIEKYQALPGWYIHFILWRMIRNGWIQEITPNYYQLTPDGKYRAAKIVRLHRLWEVYLADYLGVGAERVHRNAEEMEHIITPELEKQLTSLLKDPKKDPHHQPIPPKEGLNGL